MFELEGKKILVTGGAGFIGSHFIRRVLGDYPSVQVINLDKLTYAGHQETTKDFADNPRYKFVKGDICDPQVVATVIQRVNAVVHFAAESHVDRSHFGPAEFARTNVVGTTILLTAARDAKIERFHHISTDEVFGDLGPEDAPFDETTPYAPRTPYAASKAGSDLIVRAFFESYNLPITITNCGNNYGPFQDPEKLIARSITNLIMGEKIKLMGEGENVRDWIFAPDHVEGVLFAFTQGEVGETYCLGGEEKTNKEVVTMILNAFGLDENWIERIPHRLGHDRRYALDTTKIEKLGWKPKHNFEEGMKLTVDWYKTNAWWWRPLREGKPDIDPDAQQKLKV